jgi:CBS domain-containing protein
MHSLRSSAPASAAPWRATKVVDRGRLVGMISARDLLIFAATPHLRG